MYIDTKKWFEHGSKTKPENKKGRCWGVESGSK
jgi:hypothetical protein